MKCNLESCTGTAVIEWERDFFHGLNQSREELLDYIKENGQTLREYYCQNVCPVARFNRKYQKQEQPSRTYAFESVYPFEGGIDDNTR
jgi:hypothetical protein